MVPVLNDVGTMCAVFGNHDFGMSIIIYHLHHQYHSKSAMWDEHTFGSIPIRSLDERSLHVLVHVNTHDSIYLIKLQAVLINPVYLPFRSRFGGAGKTYCKNQLSMVDV